MSDKTGSRFVFSSSRFNCARIKNFDIQKIKKLLLNYDVVVVGAGPVGSTAARHAALNGARVLLI